MSTQLAPAASRSTPVPSSRLFGPRPHPLICSACRTEYPAQPTAICAACLGPLEPRYDPGRALPAASELHDRPRSLWRYREWLPFSGEPRYSLDSGFTPLIDAPELARTLGVARAWVKNDAVSHPSLSFKDRVVAIALNAAAAFGLETLACASTGNLANAVAAHAARAGLTAWVFVPEDTEPAKLAASAAYGARVVRVRGSYDDVNRLCSQVADRFGWGVVNVNLRSYYAEGSKSFGFELVEQLGWRFPSAVIAPLAGGALLSKLAKAFGEIRAAGLVSGASPRLFGAQAAGCAPIVELVERGSGPLRPVLPKTIARSLAIGSPADGGSAARAIWQSGGWAAAPDDDALREGIALLARTTGIFTETAGGVTTAAALALIRQGRIGPEDELVVCITGNGLKTPDALPSRLLETPLIAPRLAEVAALANHS